MRSWTDSTSGRKVDAEFAGMQGDSVLLKLANGQLGIGARVHAGSEQLNCFFMYDPAKLLERIRCNTDAASQ